MDINNHEKPTILIVEDDYDNQKFLSTFLQRSFNIFVCDSELSFYEYLNNNTIDLILMDISLRGGKDGLQLTSEIKKRPDFMDIPVVCLTAHAFQQDKENALNAGVDVFLTKPVSNSFLLNTLMDIVNKRNN